MNATSLRNNERENASLDQFRCELRVKTHRILQQNHPHVSHLHIFKPSLTEAHHQRANISTPHNDGVMLYAVLTFESVDENQWARSFKCILVSTTLTWYFVVFQFDKMKFGIMRILTLVPSESETPETQKFGT